jgi:hypothetical protein
MNNALAQAPQHTLGHMYHAGAVRCSAGAVQHRDPDLISCCQPHLGLRAAAVDPNGPLPHQTVDEAARYTLQVSQQKIVQSLAFR